MASVSDMAIEVEAPVRGVQVVELRPGDLLVVQCDDWLSADGRREIAQQFRGRPVAFLDGGRRLSVLRQDDSPSEAWPGADLDGRPFANSAGEPYGPQPDVVKDIGPGEPRDHEAQMAWARSVRPRGR